MDGSFDDDLMRADAVHAVVQTKPLPSQFAFHLQRGKLIGNDPHGPVGGVRFRRLRAIGHDLLRREALLARTEGTEGR